MSSIVLTLLIALAGLWAIRRLLLTPARLPTVRARPDGVGRAVYSLASAAQGTWLAVETEDGRLVCAFHKRPDPGGVEQDVVLRVSESELGATEAQRLRDTLRTAGYAPVTRRLRREAENEEEVFIEVAMFGRREELGFGAVAATRCVLEALELPHEGYYLFQGHGGTRDSRLWARLNRDTASRPEAVRQARELSALQRNSRG